MSETDKLVISTPKASSTSSRYSGCESIFSPDVERRTRQRYNRFVLDSKASGAPLPMLCAETEDVDSGNHHDQNDNRRRRSKRRNCSTTNNNGISKYDGNKETKNNNNMSRAVEGIPEQIWGPVVEQYFKFWFDHRIRTAAAKTTATTMTTSNQSSKQKKLSIQAPSHDNNSSALLHSVKIGDETSVTLWLIYRRKILHDEGVDIHDIRQMKPGGYNALHVAAKYGHVAIAKVLLDKQIGIFNDANVPTMHGQTALHIATRYGQLSMTSYLIEQCGANINYQSSTTGETPLMSAIAGIEQSNLSTIQYVVSQPQLNINQQDRFGQTALQLAIQNYHNCHYDDDRIVEYLLRVGKANPNITSSITQGHQTPFHFVPCYKQNWISSFLAVGVDVTIQDTFNGDTIVHYWLKERKNDTSRRHIVGPQFTFIDCPTVRSRSIQYRSTFGGKDQYRNKDLWNAMFLLLEHEKRNIAKKGGERDRRHILNIANYKGETPYGMIMASGDIRLKDLVARYQVTRW